MGDTLFLFLGICKRWGGYVVVGRNGCAYTLKRTFVRPNYVNQPLPEQLFDLNQKSKNEHLFYFCIVGVYRLHKKTGATAPRSVFYLPIKNNINIINMTNFAIIKSTCTPPTRSKINFEPFLIFYNIITIKVVL